MNPKYTIGTLLWDQEDKEFGFIISIINKPVCTYYKTYWTMNGYLEVRCSDLEDPTYKNRFLVYK